VGRAGLAGLLRPGGAPADAAGSALPVDALAPLDVRKLGQPSLVPVEYPGVVLLIRVLGVGVIGNTLRVLGFAVVGIEPRLLDVVGILDRFRIPRGPARYGRGRVRLPFQPAGHDGR
jgi:hypothetical protein